jgi:hypothetical protein
MAAQQTSVVAMTPGFAGMLADTGEKDVRSYVSEEASAEIPFGQLVKQGSADTGCLRLSAGTDVNKFLGVVVHSHAYEKDIEVGTSGIKPKMTVGVLFEGTVWVSVSEAVGPTDPVRVFIDDTGHVAGTFCKTASATHTVLISAWARFLTSTTGAGLVQLKIDTTGSVSSTADA